MAEESKIIISAVDTTKAAFSSVQSGIGKVEGAAVTLNGAIGRLAPLLGAATFTGLISSAATAADRILDVATANEVTIGSILKLSQALALNGGEADSASNLFASFTKRVEDAVTGSNDAQEGFRLLNVTLNDLAKLDGQALFEKTLSGLLSIEDPIKRNTLAMDFLGKAAKGVDIKGLAASYANNQEDFTKAEKSFEDIGLAMDKLDTFTMSTSKSMAENFGPTLLTTITYVDDLVFGFDKLEKNIRAANKARQDSGSAWKPSASMSDDPVFGQFSLPEEFHGGALRDVTPAEDKSGDKKTPLDTLKEQIDLIQRENLLVAQGVPLEDAKTIARLKQKGLGDELIVQLLNLQQETSALAALEKARAEQKQQLIEDEKMFSEGDARVIEAEIELQNEQFDVEAKLLQQHQLAVDSYDKMLDSINQETEQLQFQLSLQGLSKEAQQEKIAARNVEISLQRTLNELAEQGIGLSAEEIESLRETYAEIETLKVKVDKANNSGRELGFIFSSAAEDAIVNYKSLGDVLLGLEKDLIRIATRKLVTEPFAEAFSGIGNGLGGVAKDFFGGFFADGGRPPLNKVSVVGERGVELFVPDGPGTIIPNELIGAGTSQINVTVNVDATGGNVQGSNQKATDLGRQIEGAVRTVLLKEKRQGGILA